MNLLSPSIFQWNISFGFIYRAGLIFYRVGVKGKNKKTGKDILCKFFLGCFVCWQLQCFDLYTCNKRTYFDQIVPKPTLNGGYEHLRSWHGESLLGEMEAGGGGGGGNLTIWCPLSAGRCYFLSTVVGWIMYWYLKKKLFVDQLWW